MLTVPVVFEPRTARTLLANIFEAVHGESIYRQASFLAGKLGQKVAAETLTVIGEYDDQRLVVETALAQRVEETSDDRVRVCDLSVVGRE